MVPYCFSARGREWASEFRTRVGVLRACVRACARGSERVCVCAWAEGHAVSRARRGIREIRDPSTYWTM